MEHYAQVTDEHFERAAGMAQPSDEAAQNAARQAHAEPCMASHSDDESAKFEVKRSSASTCEYSMGRVGFEPT